MSRWYKRVAADKGADLYMLPDPTSHIIQHLKKGTKVEIYVEGDEFDLVGVEIQGTVYVRVAGQIFGYVSWKLLSD